MGSILNQEKKEKRIVWGYKIVNVKLNRHFQKLIVNTCKYKMKIVEQCEHHTFFYNLKESNPLNLYLLFSGTSHGQPGQ